MSRFARYKNGFGYRFNNMSHNRQMKLLDKMNGDTIIRHYLKTDISKDYFKGNSGIILVPNFISKIILKKEKSIIACMGELYYKKYKSFAIFIDQDCIYDNNLSYEPILYHELWHVNVRHNSYTYNSNLEEECDCDYFAAVVCGYEKTLDNLNKLYKICRTLRAKIELQERMEFIENKYIEYEIQETIF